MTTKTRRDDNARITAPGAGRETGVGALEAVIASVFFGILMMSLSGSLGGTFEFVKIQKDREVLSQKSLVALDQINTAMMGVQDESIVSEVLRPGSTTDGTTTPPPDDNPPPDDGTTQDPDAPTSNDETECATELEFSRVTGMTEDGALVQSEPIRVFWPISPTEIEDLKDNNHDGLADEGEVVVAVGGLERVVASDVPPDGFSVQDLGDGFLTISVTTQLTASDGKTVLSRTVEVKVTLR